ncbi:MAG: hydrogenase iron-sulfur subunit [Deltaproteobacteria bacterium]|nr:hydrogenase iron-sulfur subunit [Deltaproteobacteria bacterium]
MTEPAPGAQPLSSGVPAAIRDAQPPVWGEALWRPIDRGFQRAFALVGRAVPDAHNPLLHLGALANLALIVAIASGVLLLVWYTPSHTGAWESTRAMEAAPWTAGLVRSLHRYASDATILLSLLHGLQVLAARRLAGPRWVAWVTGFVSVGLIWLVGWTGYWLVWDERAQLVAVGTAQALDVLPIFTDPLARSFITNESVSSLLFFVVFFCHMLLPLLLGISLWLHLSRLARPRFLTSRALTLWALGALVLLSLVAPATSAPAADMSRVPAETTMDWWYLLPLFLTDRLSGGMLWLVTLGVGVVGLSVPWLLVRRRRAAAPDAVAAPPAATPAAPPETCRVTGAPTAPASAPKTAEPVADRRRAIPAIVDEARCNACETCFKDCPYDAISMIARSDGRKFPSVARVDPARCVGCGICAGSCDSSGIGLPWLPAPGERQRVDAWLEGAPRGETMVAFACARSAASRWTIDPTDGTTPALPGYRVVAVPCAGWVHTLTVERALRHGAAGVIVASCRPGGCAYREGAQWTADRLAATREPALRLDHVDPRRVRHVALDAFEAGALTTEAAAFRESCLRAEQPAIPAAPRARRSASRVATLVVGIVVAALLGAATWLPSDLPYRTPADPEPQLVVSFKVAGAVTQSCRELSPAELAELPPHKRVPRVCERGRQPVRLVVRRDGVVVHDALYQPSGAFGDGASVALTTLPMPIGLHDIALSIGSREDEAAIGNGARALEFHPHTRRVITFDALGGFNWH